jgi:hypothetical protein
MKWFDTNNIIIAACSLMLSAGAYLYLNQNSIDKRVVALESTVYLRSQQLDRVEAKIDKMNDLLLGYVSKPSNYSENS